MGVRFSASETRLRDVEQSLAEASAARDAYSGEADRLRGVITSETDRLRGLIASEAERYKGMIERQQAATAEVHEALAQVQSENQALYQNMDGLNVEIARLNALVAEQQRIYEARIAELLGSISWRITAPIRGTVARLRKLSGSEP
jgi:chromosome segregation ATPase